LLSLQALHVRPHTLHRAERRLLRAAADCGYWAFGYDVGDNILQTVGKPKWLIVMANLMVVRARPCRCNVLGALGRRASCMPGRRETQSSGCELRQRATTEQSKGPRPGARRAAALC